eukprot:TRINITY_DN6937_c0_g1_i3.p1 TRINITY_DN6937_c0_g1~~TRINITY_DN6937_c0_g1_i3.p1  ORF type:complete len:185 (+),score=32.04 TRINITY_DN6937_c0_g1_i3:466-1020(+)
MACKFETRSRIILPMRSTCLQAMGNSTTLRNCTQRKIAQRKRRKCYALARKDDVKDDAVIKGPSETAAREAIVLDHPQRVAISSRDEKERLIAEEFQKNFCRVFPYPKQRLFTILLHSLLDVGLTDLFKFSILLLFPRLPLNLQQDKHGGILSPLLICDVMSLGLCWFMHAHRISQSRTWTFLI